MPQQLSPLNQPRTESQPEITCAYLTSAVFRLQKFPKCSKRNHEESSLKHFSMREGKFELIVASVSDSFLGLQSYDERCINDKNYAVAIPGKEYCVKVNIYRDQNGNFTPSRLRIGLYVDGNDVQYWKRIDLTKANLLPTASNSPVSATFWGFKKNVTDIRSFQFATPKISTAAESSSSAQSDTKCLGQIHAVIYEAMVFGGTFENKNGIHGVPEDCSLPENKKFWQQPSLSTSAGRKIPDKIEQFDPLEKWVNIGPLSDPLHAMTLFYHTESTLNCIEALSVLNENSNSGIKRPANFGQCQDSDKNRNRTANEAWDLTEDDNDTLVINSDVTEQRPAEECIPIACPIHDDNTTLPITPAESNIEEANLKYEDEEGEILFVVRPPPLIEVIDISEEGAE